MRRIAEDDEAVHAHVAAPRAPVAGAASKFEMRTACDTHRIPYSLRNLTYLKDNGFNGDRARLFRSITTGRTPVRVALYSVPERVDVAIMCGRRAASAPRRPFADDAVGALAGLDQVHVPKARPVASTYGSVEEFLSRPGFTLKRQH